LIGEPKVAKNLISEVSNSNNNPLFKLAVLLSQRQYQTMPDFFYQRKVKTAAKQEKKSTVLQIVGEIHEKPVSSFRSSVHFCL